jgi:hypothetical protein
MLHALDLLGTFAFALSYATPTDVAAIVVPAVSALRL